MLIRYFAAARAAAGTREETRAVDADTSLATLLKDLAGANDALAGVIPACSYLLNGTAVAPRVAADHSLAPAVSDSDTLDVLPPFAGG